MPCVELNTDVSEVAKAMVGELKLADIGTSGRGGGGGPECQGG